MRRIARIAVTVAVVVAASWYGSHRLYRCPGCRSLDAQRNTWRALGITDYSYVYEEGGMACCSRARVTVRGGRVVHVQVLQRLFTVANPTVDGVFALARHEMHAADRVLVDYDPRDAFPTSVRVDPNVGTKDDEYGFSITQFRPLRGAAG